MTAEPWMPALQNGSGFRNARPLPEAIRPHSTHAASCRVLISALTLADLPLGRC